MFPTDLSGIVEIKGPPWFVGAAVQTYPGSKSPEQPGGYRRRPAARRTEGPAGYLLAFLLLSSPAYSATITPESFERLAKTSLDVTDTFRTYYGRVRKADPAVFGDVDAVFTLENDPLDPRYSVPTTIGEFGVNEVSRMDAAAYGRLRLPQVDVGFWAIYSELRLNTQLEDWDFGHSVLAVTFSRPGGFSATAGSITRYEPLVAVSSTGARQFDFEPDSRSIANTSRRRRYGFAHLDLYGTDVAVISGKTLLDPTLLELRHRLAPGQGGAEWELAASRYRFRDTLQAGGRVRAPELFWRTSAEAELFFNLGKQGAPAGLAFAVVSGEMTLPLPRTAARLSARPGLSYDRDVLDDGVAGWLFEVAVREIPLWSGKLAFLLGWSDSYHSYLRRLPLKDQDSMRAAVNYLF